MLKQALEYEAQLKILLNRASIEIDNQWYFGNPGGYTYEIADNTVWRRDFVSVDAEDNVIGLINYNIDCHSGNTYKWGLISFKKGNLILMKDLETAIVDVFEKYRLNRISFCCFVGNPALRGYSNLIDKLGGTQCGYKHATCRLLDNRLYDEVDFEILAKDYFNSEYYLKKHSKENKLMSVRTEKEEIAEGLANELIDFVNTFGQCYEVFAKTICKSHRYLQGEVFLLMIEVIREMSKNEYDERNEYAVRKCREIVSLLDN